MCEVCGIIGAVHEDSNVSTDTYAPSSTKPVATTAQIVNYLTTQWPGQVGYTRTWQNASNLTYSIPTTPDLTASEGLGFKVMTAGQVAAAREAFELWDDLIAISLSEVTGLAANITFSYSTKTSGGGNYARTYTSYFGGTDLALTKAAVWLNAATATHDTDADMFQGGYGVLTYVHEVGHTLGLSHPGVYDASLGSVTYASGALFAQDTRQHTVMSYFQAGSDASGVDHVGAGGSRTYAATPLLYDIAAIQAKYGADMTTRTGDTIYGFNANAGRSAFDFTKNKNPVVAIWDAGGVDTLDVSGFTQNQRITLVAGAYSDVGAMTNNVAIAFGAVIENAVGGSGNDVIEGNAVANVLTGGAGNDTLWGGGGADTFAFGSGSGADRIEDFQVGVDKIRFDGLESTITSFASLVLTAAAGGVTVSWGLTGASVFLAGVSVGQLTAADFGLSAGTGSTGSTTGSTSGSTTSSGTGGSSFTGTAGNDSLVGGLGADTLSGSDGNDTLVGGGGADLLDGGAGSDTVTYAKASSAVAVNLSSGVHAGDAAGDRFVSIERWALTGYADRFVGTAATESVVAGAGDDVIVGGGGTDRLMGGSGADTFVFGGVAGAATVSDFEAGLDKIRIDVAGVSGFAQVILADETAGVRVSWGSTGASVLLSGKTAAQIAASDFLFGPESAPTGAPSAPASVGSAVTGDANANKLTGTEGADSLYGFAGGDTLDGGAGGDLLDGGDGSDTVTYATAQDALTIDLSGGGHTGDAQGDQFVSVERWALTKFADRFIGTLAAESVVAGAGDDIVSGGGGADRLTGGAGADVFVFGAAAGGAKITDFEVGLDRIQITAGATGYAGLTFTDVTGGVKVSWGVANASVTVTGVTKAQLTSAHFVFSSASATAADGMADAVDHDLAADFIAALGGFEQTEGTTSFVPAPELELIGSAHALFPHEALLF